jgi:hypothetical protein
MWAESRIADDGGRVRTSWLGWRIRYRTACKALDMMPFNGSRCPIMAAVNLEPTIVDETAAQATPGNRNDDSSVAALKRAYDRASSMRPSPMTYSTIKRKMLGEVAFNSVANPRAGITPWKTASNGGVPLSVRATCRCPASSSNVTSLPVARDTL